jgi:hypothetical protein
VRRRLFNLLTALSLLVCVAVCALWVRSYIVGDGVRVTCGNRAVSFFSCAGTMAVVWEQSTTSPGYYVDRFTDLEPDPPGGGYGAALLYFQAGRMLPWSRGWIVCFPHWMATAVTAALPGVRFARRHRRRTEPAGFPAAAP